MSTKALLGGLIGGIAVFFIGWLVWGMALSGIMEAHTNMNCMRPEAEMNMVYIALSNLLWAFAFAYLWQKANIITFASGATSGAIVSVLIGLSIDLMMYTFSTLNTSLTPALINIPANLVVGGLLGGIIGWWLGRK
jgi:hypothetical protein